MPQFYLIVKCVSYIQCAIGYFCDTKMSACRRGCCGGTYTDVGKGEEGGPKQRVIKCIYRDTIYFRQQVWQRQKHND